MTTAHRVLFAVIAVAAQTFAADEDNPRRKRVDRAVDAGLEYLAKNVVKGKAIHAGREYPIAYWTSDSYGRNTGVCSLAIMAFLARGHVPGEGPHGKLLDEAIDFVVFSQQGNGLVVEDSGSKVQMYAHGISTLLLSEVLGMTTGERNQRIRAALAKAVKLTLQAQSVPKGGGYQGGWRYTPDASDADITCTGWQLMSLRAGAGVGVEVPEKAILAAVKYIRSSAVPGGGFSYQPQSQGRVTMGTTGTSILSLEICSAHDLPESRRGGDWLLNRGLTYGGDPRFFYGVYYATQAMFQLGGKYWETFQPRLEDCVIPHQRPDGSFAEVSTGDSSVGAIYRTSMICLALSVQYRYLPIYQR